MSLQDIVGKNCIFLVKHFPFALYHIKSLKMSFGIHKSSFSLFTALKSTTYSQIFPAQNIGNEWEWPVTSDGGSSVSAQSSIADNHMGFTENQK